MVSQQQQQQQQQATAQECWQLLVRILQQPLLQ
jgi:hypothetical protein